MKRILGLFTALAALALGTNAIAASFGAGNIVIVRVGNGSQILTNLGNSVYLDEYTTNAIWANAGNFTSPTPVQSIPMPTNWVGSQGPLIISGIATAAGGLNRSVDGRYLVLTGYGTTLGNVTNSPSTLSGTNFSLSSTTTTGQFNQVARVVGLVDGNGHVYTGITLTSPDEDDEEPRAAVSLDGTNVWLAGDTTGTKYLPGGRTSMTSTQVGTSANTRFLSISSNVLYYSANHILGVPTNTSVAVNPFGGSMPTSFVKSNYLLLAGVYGNSVTSSAAKGSPFAFSFVNNQGGSTPDTLYVADNVTNAPGEPNGKAGGVLKYCYVPASNAWVGLGYIFADQAYGVTAVKNGANVDLYITEGGTVTPLNAVYPYTDFSGYLGSPQSNGDGGDANGNKVILNPIGNANINTRGIAFAPQGGDGGTLTPNGGISVGPPYGPYFRGAAGGPFGPTNYTYSICNLNSTITTNWFLQLLGFGSPTWLTASATSGTLAPGASTTITLTPNAGANGKQGGSTYTGNVVIRNNNLTGPIAITLPATLVVDAFFDTPNSNYTAVGSPGGPFSPPSIVYAITNATGTNRTWAVTNAVNWYTISATNGSLAANSTTNITVSINANANSLPIGVYSDTLVFTDVTGNHQYDSHFVNLQVGFGFFDDFSSANFTDGPIVGQQNWYNPTTGDDDDPYNIVGGVLVLPGGGQGCSDTTLQEPAKSISSAVVTNPGFVYLGISMTVTSAYSTAATWDFAMEPFLFGGTVANNKARSSVNDIGGGNYRWNTHVNGFDSLRPGTIARTYGQHYFVYIVSDVANSNCWVFVNPPDGTTSDLFGMTPDAHDGPDVAGWGGPSSGGIGGIDIDHFCSSSTQAGMLIYKIAMSTNYTDVFNFLTATNTPPTGDPFTTWQTNYFTPTELSNPAFSGPGADPLGKGMSNTNQFLAGFNPTNAAAYVHITNISKVNSGTDIRVDYLGASGDSTYSPGFASRTNVLEFTAGTGGGSYSSNGFASAGVTNVLSGGVGLGTLTNMVDPGGATNVPSRYYRVRVLVP